MLAKTPHRRVGGDCRGWSRVDDCAGGRMDTATAHRHQSYSYYPQQYSQSYSQNYYYPRQYPRYYQNYQSYQNYYPQPQYYAQRQYYPRNGYMGGYMSYNMQNGYGQY